MRILIIEDDDDLRATLGDLVESWGHTVETAASGTDGLRQMFEAPPDVALIDIGLPDIDGCQVAQRTRARLGSAARLVALSGFTQRQDRRRILGAGFDSYIAKPPDIEALRRIVTVKRRDLATRAATIAVRPRRKRT